MASRQLVVDRRMQGDIDSFSTVVQGLATPTSASLVEDEGIFSLPRDISKSLIAAHEKLGLFKSQCSAALLSKNEAILKKVEETVSMGRNLIIQRHKEVLCQASAAAFSSLNRVMAQTLVCASCCFVGRGVWLGIWHPPESNDQEVHHSGVRLRCALWMSAVCEFGLFGWAASCEWF